MRIKRFIAPDMRTALRMVRDEQGPDAVILSNRPTDDGIEIVAATDYDESLAQQALRAALPSLPPTPAPVASPTTPATVAAVMPPLPTREDEETSGSRLGSLATLLTKPAIKSKPAWTTPVADIEEEAAEVTLSARARNAIAESPIRGRAVFAIGEAPAGSAPVQPTVEPARAVTREPKAEARVAAAASSKPDTSRFDAMMAALISQGDRFEQAVAVPTAAVESTAQVADAVATSPNGSGIEGEARAQDHASGRDDVESMKVSPSAMPSHSADPHPSPTPAHEASAPIRVEAVDSAPRETHLHAVPDQRDPTLLAMREEMATMRALIERELAQMSVERLRGSPARAAAFDALMNYGCDENLAQTIAGRIDARLDPSQVREPMLAELARALSVVRSEPIDDGGVIALVGPTGAGKTTTAAKLAARFAQRHRARDVALVTTDTERPGATEQLHILGRRLGVTVCEANGPEALNDALDQLADYPLVLVDTAGHGLRDRALLGQILWLRAAKRVRSLLVLPANTQAHDLGEVIRRYRPASPEGVVLTKLDETGRLGSALSVMVQHGLSLAYTTDGQQVPHDLAAADATALVKTLEKVRRAADNPLGSLDARPVSPRSLTLPTEDRHAFAS
ncbi:flagellar biosynthesis protein FlhF [Lysobacter panacisoli]|uniref:Flagellar biosynthesis protein FlhF n=1 Tax=Lysobacter panacisoli TaxID=1255263 RepID=A0ABP9LL56_9GAMM|nr:flagellar biosynthesis protein FlhF [Lysobacter panacisoli]